MANKPRKFPDLTPTARSFDPGTFPQTMFEAQNGATSVIRYSNKRVNAKLSMTFKNLSNQFVDNILDHYISVNDDWDYVFFDNNHPALAGLNVTNGDLKKYIKHTPGGLRWRYTESPKVTSVIAGVSTVECKFNAYLDG